MDNTRFRIITGKSSVRRPDKETYRQALLRFHEQYSGLIQFDTMGEWSRNGSFKKFLFLTIRYIWYGREELRNTIVNKEGAKLHLDFMFSVLDMVSLLTPKELVQMFPVEKRYDGEKYQEKIISIQWKRSKD